MASPLELEWEGPPNFTVGGTDAPNSVEAVNAPS
jgi:hypothetical protein